MIGCAKMGLHFVACAPKAYWPNPELVAKCREFARLSGGSITLSEDTDAVAGADVVYTDVWVSMGEPVEVWELSLIHILCVCTHSSGFRPDRTNL